MDTSHRNKEIKLEKKSLDSCAQENNGKTIYKAERTKMLKNDEESYSSAYSSELDSNSCWSKFKDKIRVGQKDATPLNWKFLFLVFMSLLCSSISLVFIFPFLPDMVVRFGYKEEEKGYYAGFVASGVFAGRACGSFFWGWLSDKIGRRPVILITVIGNGIFAFVFGFSTNIPFAFAMRFMTGLLNGTVGAAKTVLYEICDNTNQALGMAILTVAWGGGMILGPTLGGLLASPATNYPEVFSESGIFGQFPYLMPGIIIFIICVVSTVINFFWLPETLGKSRAELEKIGVKFRPEDTDREEIEGGEKSELIPSGQDNNVNNFRTPTIHKRKLEATSTSSLPKMTVSVEDLHMDSDYGALCAQHHLGDHHHQNSSHHHHHFSSPHHGHHHLHHHQHPNPHCKVASNGLTRSQYDLSSNCNSPGANSILMRTYSESGSRPSSQPEQFLPLNGHTGVTEPPKDSAEEQVNLDVDGEPTESEKKKGILQRIKNSSLIQLLSQSDVRQSVLLYTFFSFGTIGYEEIFIVWASTEKYFDGLGYTPKEIGAILGMSSAPLIICNFFLFPLMVAKFSLKGTFIACSALMMVIVPATPTLHLFDGSTTMQKVLIMVPYVSQKITTSCCFSATSLFINNSSPPGKTGSVNGIGMTMTAIARAAAPAFGGSIFAWSISFGPSIGAPFDVSLSFFVLGTLIWLTTVYSVFLNPSLNNQKK